MSAATVMRLRSRLDNSLRSHTSSNRTRSVSSTSFGEKSPISFPAPSEGFGICSSPCIRHGFGSCAAFVNVGSRRVIVFASRPRSFIRYCAVKPPSTGKAAPGRMPLGDCRAKELLQNSSSHLLLLISAVAQLFHLFGISLALDRYLGGGAFHRSKLVARKLDFRSSNVFFEAMRLGCARNGNDPRLLCQEPCKRDLRRRCSLLVRKSVEEGHHRLVRIEVLRSKARDRAAKVRAVKLRLRRDFSRKETLAQRAVRNETNTQFFESWQNLLFGSPEP